MDQPVNDGDSIGVGIDLYLMATPDISGYRFVNWTVNNGTVAEPNAARTVFTMGTGDATISATFEPIASHSLTFSAPTGGSMIVGDNLTSPQTIGEGVVLSFDLDITTAYAGGVFHHEIIPISIKLNDMGTTAWNMNTKYTYYLQINPSQKTVLFDPAVEKDWTVVETTEQTI